MVVVNGNFKDENLWNSSLMNLNAELGSEKEVNMVVVAAYDLPLDFSYAIADFNSFKSNHAYLNIP